VGAAEALFAAAATAVLLLVALCARVEAKVMERLSSLPHHIYSRITQKPRVESDAQPLKAGAASRALKTALPHHHSKAKSGKRARVLFSNLEYMNSI